VSRLPSAKPTGELVATITSVNEYLAESQALATVQLRKTIDSVIAGFAHEVRNPLAAILSLTEAAIQQEPALESRLVRIPGLVARVESLIKHSLAYSRPKPPNRALHRPLFLVDRATLLLRPRDTAVRLDLPDEGDDELPVLVDVLHAEQMLVNLIENALDMAQSVVTVRVEEVDGAVPAVCISVADDGPGVPADAQSRIFDPFFTTKAAGTGLGLAIARDLARLNGGDLQLRPSEHGAVFVVLLPSTNESLRGHW
jgi:signal transduction histidine kinase